MGGLIVRSYLSGKQTQEGVFTPPADTKVRKIVFLGTPHFGTPATSLLGGLGGLAGAMRKRMSFRQEARLCSIWRRGIKASTICGEPTL